MRNPGSFEIVLEQFFQCCWNRIQKMVRRVKKRIAGALSDREIPRKFFTIGYGGLDPEQ